MWRGVGGGVGVGKLGVQVGEMEEEGEGFEGEGFDSGVCGVCSGLCSVVSIEVCVGWGREVGGVSNSKDAKEMLGRGGGNWNGV
jgi:hypothetical protein